MPARPLYDRIGVGYADRRRPDPAIAGQIERALGDAVSIVNVGAGTGSYEPIGRRVVAIEPSSVMIAQRRPDAAPIVRAVGEDLPIRASSFDVALAVLTLHHWRDPLAGLGEMRRVAKRQLVLTFDPDMHCSHWLTDYVPEVAPLFRTSPPVALIAKALDAVEVQTVPIRHDTPDGMTIAYWHRPEAYLDPHVRAACSALQQVDQAALERGLRVLEADLTSGEWRRRYGDLLEVESMDYGLRLIVS